MFMIVQALLVDKMITLNKMNNEENNITSTRKKYKKREQKVNSIYRIAESNFYKKKINFFLFVFPSILLKIINGHVQ